MSRIALALTLAALPAVANATPPLLLRTFGTLVAGEPVLLRLSAVAPGETAVFVAGSAVVPGATCPPGLATCLDVVGARVIARGVADVVGSVEVQVVLPTSVGVGGAVALQAVQPSSGAVSQAFSRSVSDHIGMFGVFDDPTGAAGPIEIDDQGTRDPYQVTSIADFDNTTGVAYASWLRPNGWYYWQRLDWVEVGGDLWYCSSIPHPSEWTVRMTMTADRSNPAVGGCHGAPWTLLVPAEPEIAGTWVDPLGRTVEIDEDGWMWGRVGGAVSRFSNQERSMVAQNDPGGPLAGRWSRLDWTVDAAGQPALCLTRRDAPTEWAARATPAADPGDLAAGCAGGAWTALR
jgi:hypothetical protein